MKRFATDSALQAAKIMRVRSPGMPFSSALFALALALSLLPSRAADTEGVAVAIVYDTSGSMRELVKDQDGNPAPKYVIANRALKAIADQLQAYTGSSQAGTPRKVEAGVYIFAHNTGSPVVDFGSLDAGAIRKWASGFSAPAGNTPLGNAINVAAQRVLASSLPHKHVLVITDGVNNVGPAPSNVLLKMKKQADQKGTSLSTHFVAFDVSAKVFDTVRSQGATVVAAANGKELDSQLQYILQQKILLEDEEPPKPVAK
jgi:von Willebrand factor type A domain